MSEIERRDAAGADLSRQVMELRAENERLRTAAERVCWYDWSSNNDADAVAAVEGLRRALEGSGSA